MTKKILICTGGTGGHIFPALTLKKYLEAKDIEVIVTADEKFARFHNFDKQHILIPSAHFVSKSPLAIIKSLFVLTQGFLKSFFLILNEKPTQIIGFGGYATFPVLLAAAILKKIIILHEANTVLGKVNRLFFKRAKFITTGFKSLYGVDSSNKIFFTGNPVREGIAAKKRKTIKKLFNILVIGGSQGAKIFSKIIPEVIINLPSEIKAKISITQQVKEEDVDIIKNKYENENIVCEIKSFFKDMDTKFKEADLVIARAGASTISEIIKTSLPAIFIPYPYAADNHQHCNAMELINLNSAWLVEESEKAKTDLLAIIESIFKNPEILKAYTKNLQTLDTDACANIYKLLSI